jgi:hypothetical protein
VTITYDGAGGTCRGVTVVGPAVAIPPHSSHVFYQGDPAGQGLTENCYGSAVIQSSGSGVLAIVNEALDSNRTSAAYNAFSADQAATSVALPLYRKQHVRGLTTGIAAMNVGTRDAQITVSFSQTHPDRTSTPVTCGAACRQTVGPHQTAVFWPGLITELPPGTYGSATVHSTEPIVVIVNDVSESGEVDMATYSGMKADPPLAPGVFSFAALPRLLLDHSE